MTHLRSDRLILRTWRDSDRAAFAAMNGDPVVMEFFPATLDRAESDAFVDRIEQHFERNEWGLWAVEVFEGSPFIGYVGLWSATFPADFTPAVEVGWRLDRAYWGHGFATEAARVSMDDGFARLGLEEIVSFTSTRNVRSQRVMQRLGMRRDRAEDFDHPALPVGHPLRRHVLFRQDRESWPA